MVRNLVNFTEEIKAKVERDHKKDGENGQDETELEIEESKDQTIVDKSDEIEKSRNFKNEI